MIVFEKIRWKNFLSTGNTFTEVELNKNTTTLIVGTNGAGKSTILDALCFSLFNKSFRKINKNQLINTTNEKGCVVEVEFSVGRNKYKIIRGMKPNIFEIIKDGESLDQSSNSIDQQKYLEQTILKLNYKSFTQIVILGSSNFVPFMQLNPQSRREVIEDLLDIRIFSHMNLITKERIRQCKEDIKVYTIKKNNLEDKVEMQKNFIQEIESKGKQNIKDKKNKLTVLSKEALDLISKNEETSKEVDRVNSEMEEFSKATTTLRKMGGIKGKLETKKETEYSQVNFFNKNSVCPTCTQNIEESFRVNKIEELNASIKKYEDGLQDLSEKIKEEEEKEKKFLSFSKELNQLTNDISKNTARICGIQKQSKDLEQEIQSITNSIQDRNTQNEILDSLEDSLKNITSEIYDKKADFDNYELIHNLLRDDGVKTKIVKKYLPVINKQINRYLQLMDFYVNFNLDEEFKETVQSPIHEDFSYTSFSEGEKMRIDLALLFTWREIAKLKNSSSTNLLIMDEVFDSSLDTYGTDEFMKIIRYVVKDSNVFVISHKSEVFDKFDSVIKFDKVKGFSSIVE
tara:strand:+ start:1112 stop:2824 length:1713 start_codon:yes stop_codon:yes gene_type:complete